MTSGGAFVASRCRLIRAAWDFMAIMWVAATGGSGRSGTVRVPLHDHGRASLLASHDAIRLDGALPESPKAI